MAIFRNVVFIAAAAGLVAGVLLAAMQSFATVPLVLQAETFVTGGGGHDHSHDGAAAHEHATADGDAAAANGHHHDEDAWAPADGFERFAYNVLANVVTGFGFALVLAAVSELAGGIRGWRQGLTWGFAGFAVFTLAPGLGLPPELPAMPAADLVGRQVWWTATVIATAAGLGLVAIRGSLFWSLVGVALIVAPHVVGAPQPASYDTAVPDELHHRFVVAVTVTNLLFWLVLGGLAGAVRSRFLKPADGLSGSLA